MADSFINKLSESITVKSSDFVAFDIADSNTGRYYTKKVSFSTLSNKVSSDVVSNLQLKLNLLQNNINNVASTIGGKLDKKGLTYDPNEKVTGVLVLNSGFSALGLSDFDGEVNLHNNKITTLADPTNSYDAAHKKYVDDKFSLIPSVNTNAYILKTGDVMTGGFLKLANDPVDPMEAATKRYVDNKAATFSNYLPINGGTMLGSINLNNNKITNVKDIDGASAVGDAVNYKYVRGINPSAKFFPLSGGLMNTGFINLNGNRIYNVPDVSPATTDTDVVNKRYVDSRTSGTPTGVLLLAGGTMSGIINVNNNKITNVPDVSPSSSDGDAVNKKYVDSKTSTPPAGVLLLAGGTMSGIINVNNNKITNVPDVSPSSSAGDAVNKKYVDSKGPYLELSGGSLTGPLVIKSFSEKIGSATSSGSPAIFNFDISSGNTFTITMPTTIARFTTTNQPSDSFSITVVITQNSAAPYNITAWTIDGVTIKWSGGTTPTLTQTVNKIDIFAFTKIGANWFGFIGGQNF